MKRVCTACYTESMSLTSDDLADIKQLMQALLQAQEERMMNAMDKRFDEVYRRMDERFDQVYEHLDEQDDKLNTIMDAVGTRFNEQDEQLDNHEERIVRLEKRVA